MKTTKNNAPNNEATREEYSRNPCQSPQDGLGRWSERLLGRYNSSTYQIAAWADTLTCIGHFGWANFDIGSKELRTAYQLTRKAYESSAEWQSVGLCNAARRYLTSEIPVNTKHIPGPRQGSEPCHG